MIYYIKNYIFPGAADDDDQPALKNQKISIFAPYNAPITGILVLISNQSVNKIEQISYLIYKA